MHRLPALLDQKRWIDFTVAAHRDGSQLHATTLRRWLTEIEDWIPEAVDRFSVSTRSAEKSLPSPTAAVWRKYGVNGEKSRFESLGVSNSRIAEQAEPGRQRIARSVHLLGRFQHVILACRLNRADAQVRDSQRTGVDFLNSF